MTYRRGASEDCITMQNQNNLENQIFNSTVSVNYINMRIKEYFLIIWNTNVLNMSWAWLKLPIIPLGFLRFDYNQPKLSLHYTLGTILYYLYVLEMPWNTFKNCENSSQLLTFHNISYYQNLMTLNVKIKMQ